MRNSVYNFVAITIESLTGNHVSAFSRDTNLNDLCDSLERLELIEAIEKRYGLHIDDALLIPIRTVGELSDLILTMISNV